jgi:hypothetical protein
MVIIESHGCGTKEKATKETGQSLEKKIAGNGVDKRYPLYSKNVSMVISREFHARLSEWTDRTACRFDDLSLNMGIPFFERD